MTKSTPAMLPPHTAGTHAAREVRPSQHDYAPLDLTDDEWVLAASLLSNGITPHGLLDLIRLRKLYPRPPTAALDGFMPDPRMLFARWLVQRGLLTEAP